MLRRRLPVRSAPKDVPARSPAAPGDLEGATQRARSGALAAPSLLALGALGIGLAAALFPAPASRSALDATPPLDDAARLAAAEVSLPSGMTVPPVDAAPHRADATPRPARQFQRSETVPYDGSFTFTRVRYSSGGGFRRGYGGGAWAHDYPMADLNMQVMLNEFTTVRATERGSNVFDLENREIFKHPILYVSEPGFWGITSEGAANLREFLLKGGFLIFDDFEEDQWYNMADQVYAALPEGRWVEIDETHPIFDTFFYVENIYVPHPLVRVTPNYRVIFEDNDPAKRIMVLANHNSDLAEYWEYAAQGYFPVDPTNDAFRLGINYIVYGLTR